jgi:hypothetical protein
LLVVLVGKKYITHDGRELILDSLRVLKDFIPEVYGKVFAISHIVLAHLFSEENLENIGCSLITSTSKFECALGPLKRSIRCASNKHVDWHATMLHRNASGDCLARFLDQDGVTDPTISPIYI